jgi:hypothetical protein
VEPERSRIDFFCLTHKKKATSIACSKNLKQFY